MHISLIAEAIPTQKHLRIAAAFNVESMRTLVFKSNGSLKLIKFISVIISNLKLA